MADIAVARIGREPLLAAIAVPVAVTVVLLLSGRALGTVPAFMPGFLAVVWTLDLLTAFLLLTQYTAGASPRLLVLGGAYLWSSAVIVPHALVFNGLFAEKGLLGAVPSSAPWLWTAWHVGFPLLIGLAMAPWPARLSRSRLTGRRGAAIAATITAVLAGVAAVTWLVTAGHEHIAVIIVNGDFSPLTERFGPYIIGLNLIALILAATRFRRDALRGLEAWAFVAVAASCGDTVLTLFSRARFTVGWYGARVLALAAALVVLTALLHEISVLYRRVRATAIELAERNDELKTANALREHMVAVVSHELRTPLTGLSSVVEILQDGRDQLPPETTDDLLSRGDVLVRRMSMLTEDLLAVTTADHGDLHVSPTAVSAREAMRESAAMFPRLDVRVRDSPDLWVYADPLRLQQILANYVRNSVKYGTAPIVLSATAAGDLVEFRVRDHGPGVPAAFVPRLFDRFTRSDEARVGSVAGSGLGLSIVASLARAHGGAVWYEAAEPGACFVVSLPSTPAPDAPMAGAPLLFAGERT